MLFEVDRCSSSSGGGLIFPSTDGEDGGKGYVRTSVNCCLKVFSCIDVANVHTMCEESTN